MSPWSEWGLCDSICGYGLKNRTSRVVRLASVGGRPCPGPTVQYALCNYPCHNFFWLASAWSDCAIDDKKSCGRGRKTRTIRLVVIRQRQRHYFFKMQSILGAWKKLLRKWKWMYPAITVIPRKDLAKKWTAKSGARDNAWSPNGQSGHRATR